MGVVGSSRVSEQAQAKGFSNHGPEEQEIYLYELNALKQVPDNIKPEYNEDKGEK